MRKDRGRRAALARFAWRRYEDTLGHPLHMDMVLLAILDRIWPCEDEGKELEYLRRFTRRLPGFRFWPCGGSEPVWIERMDKMVRRELEGRGLYIPSDYPASNPHLPSADAADLSRWLSMVMRNFPSWIRHEPEGG